MSNTLPSKLSDAEEQAQNSIIAFLKDSNETRLSSTLKFEGLRLMPIVIRLALNLTQNKITSSLVWADAGGTALAKREAPDLKEEIFSYKDILNQQESIDTNKLLICVSPQPYDYIEFNQLCEQYSGRILMINGRLEDAAVGIGSVARERRRNFINSWNNIYWVEPISGGALFYSYPSEWTLFKLYPDGYRKHKTFSRKPSSEILFEELNLN